MAKPKYVELVFAANVPVPSHSMAGYQIVSDYSDSGSRHLFCKRPEPVGSESSKGVQTRRRKKSNSQPATAPVVSPHVGESNG